MSASGSYEWVTNLLVRHYAGSEEGAIHQRNEWSKLIDASDGDVVFAATGPGDAGGIALQAMEDLTIQDDD